MSEPTIPPNETIADKPEDPITIDEVEEIAKKRLRKSVYDYYACGADDQLLLRRNIEVFDRLYILPRVLRDVSHVDTTVKLFGWTSSLPIGIAPSAMHKLAGGDGEIDVAKAAAKLGVGMTLSSNSTTSLEDVVAAYKSAIPRVEPSSGDTSASNLSDNSIPGLWFQLYLSGDSNKNLALVKRAEAAGYAALALTVDTPVLGNRLNERKVPLVLPPGLRLANIEEAAPPPGDSAEPPATPRKPTMNRALMDARTAAQAAAILAEAGHGMHSAALTWDVIGWLRQATSMRIVLKGIMAPEDAALAVQHGADAIVVSNHGGRQLDSAPSTLEALPGIAAAVGGRIPVILDGGVRRGSDVFKALALGADLVLVGRPVLWGLSYKGQEGVETVLNILERELSRTMALSGVTKVNEIQRSMLGVTSRDGFGITTL